MLNECMNSNPPLHKLICKLVISVMVLAAVSEFLLTTTNVVNNRVLVGNGYSGSASM